MTTPGNDISAARDALAAHQARLAWGGATLCDACGFVDALRAALFPHFRSGAALELSHLERLRLEARQLAEGLRIAEPQRWPEDLIAHLPALAERLYADARAMLERDPAASHLDEVIMAYPGYAAIVLHRVAHHMLRSGVRILPRVISEYAHSQTGVDIHPGATIGDEFCIDHATGVVIGETTIIGNRVTIYQGVTLGALSVRKGLAQTKRHPTIEDDVTIYANATILGGNTVIGRGSVIGGNVWLTRSVPPGSVLMRKPDAPSDLVAGDEYII